MTAWQALDDSPYEVLKLERPVPGEIPYVIVPGKYAGSWLEPADKGSPVRRRMQREAEDFVARRGLGS